MPLPMPFQISGRYQTINHPGQYISVSVYNVQYNNSTQTETVFRHNLYLICLGKIQSHLADAVIVIYEGRLQYLIVCVYVCEMGRRDSWVSVWSRKLISLHTRWAGSGSVNPRVQYRNPLHFFLVFY